MDLKLQYIVRLFPNSVLKMKAFLRVYSTGTCARKIIGQNYLNS